MKINAALKAALVERFNLASDVSDTELKQLVADKMLAGEMEAENLVDWSQGKAEKSPREKLADLVNAQINTALAPVVGAIGTLAESVKAIATERVEREEDTRRDSALNGAVNSALETAVEKAVADRLGRTGADPRVAQLFGRGGKGGAPDIKSVEKMYSTTKSAVLGPTQTADGQPSHHPYAGRPVKMFGQTIDSASDLEKAVVGAVFKRQVAVQSVNPAMIPRGLQMTDHDRALLAYGLHELKWTGYLDGLDNGTHEVKDRKLTDMEVKALLDDVTSGGSAVVPIIYDQMIIETPLLYGQLFPLVELIPLAQGRVIQSARFKNPTITSGPAEGASGYPGSNDIALETTADYIADIDTTVFNATGAFEIGRDFVEDTPINVAEIITRTYGYSYQAWLDKVIAKGNGSTEPMGVTVAPGTTLYSTVNNVNGPITPGDLEGMVFGVPLAVRQANGGSKLAFASTDTAYRRVRGIPVGVDDARRIFGMDLQEYRTYGFPHRVCNDLADSTLFYGNFAYYRMWRRRGLDIRVEMAGRSLALANTMLIVARARFGGNVMLGSAFCKTTTAPSFDS